VSAFLPQRDPNRAARAGDLQAAQQNYQFNYTYVSPLAVVERVPWHDEFSFHWIKTVAETVVTTLANRAEVDAGEHAGTYHATKHSFLRNLIKAGPELLHGVKQIVCDALRFEGRIGARPTRAQSLEEYAGLFRAIGLPPIANGYAADKVFAWMRVAGPNPMMLTRMTARDDRFPVADADFRVAAPDDSLDAALADGRLFLCDYHALDGAECGDYPHGAKYIYAPLAMFVVERATGDLTPIAIQCKQKPAADNPIFTPADGHNWLIAKTVVEIADGNYHEAFSHLGRTHLFMEPFAISTVRQLAPNHPVRLLLMPHFEGTLAINEAAWKHLIANKGAVDKLFGGSLNTSRKLTVLGVQSARATDLLVPKTFAARGVGDRDVLPLYPYRDDALLHWDAIHSWVGDYLALYYQSDADVAEDDELCAWGRELAAQDGGRLNGLPNDGSFRTAGELTDVLALVLFTCSTQHAAVNFPQYDLMSYVPGMPLASYAPAPIVKTGATETDYLAMLPPMDMAELQVELGYILGSVRYTQLGQYREDQFRDPRVADPLAAFQERLATVGKTIEHRNLSRPRPYEFLVPAGVPQSINI
jgi:arachidonate 15-lipoxygenase